VSRFLVILIECFVHHHTKFVFQRTFFPVSLAKLIILWLFFDDKENNNDNYNNKYWHSECTN